MAAILAAGWWACTPEPSCNDIYIPAVLASFYRLDEEGRRVRDTVFFEAVYAAGAPSDTSLVNSTDTILTYVLYVNPLESATTYNFCLNDTCNTLTLTYDRREFLLSPECGPRYRFQNLSVESDFDSVSVLKTELNIVGGINVEIFR